MTEREALKLALEALERGVKDGYWNKDTVDASTRIKEVLSQPKQEPVARYFEDYQGQPIEEIDEERFNQTPEECRFKLYTAPPQRKPLEGVIDVQPIGYHSLQLIFRSQTDIAKFKAAHGIKE